LSAKTGGCPEDCHFCSQSAKFQPPVLATPFLSRDDVLAAARETAALGASEFCIVLAVRGPDERIMGNLCDVVPFVRDATGLNVAVSAGILDDWQAARLAEAGVHRYNHNLETAKSFFGRIVTTHTWEERFETCQLVRRHGMELCCGVLLGMGESDEQRVELLLQVREADPAEVPINFLNPRPGTPLGDRPLVAPLEAIRWIALFRLGLPGVILRYAGGREVTLRELQAMGLTAGINARIVGNYLTTLGRSPSEDLQTLVDPADAFVQVDDLVAREQLVVPLPQIEHRARDLGGVGREALLGRADEAEQAEHGDLDAGLGRDQRDAVDRAHRQAPVTD